MYIFFNNIIFCTSLNLLKLTGAGLNLLTSNLSTLLLIKFAGRYFNVSISNLSISDFKLAKGTFLAKDDASILAAFFKSVFVA